MAYRIKSVERLTGLPRSTITAWERRYGLLVPQKDDSGYRVYTDEDVAVLRGIKEQLDQGFQIGEAIRRRAAPAAPTPAEASVRPLDAARDAIYAHLLEFDRAGADQHHAHVAEAPFRARLDELYAPMLLQVGDDWEAGRATVAQEHFVSAFCREQIIALLRSLDHGPETGPVAVCAGLPGEFHELGLLTVAAHLALRGHRVVYLGADLPAEELTAWLRTHRADLVAQSAVMPRDPEALFAHASRVRAVLSPETLLVLGGPAVLPLRGRSLPGVLWCPRVDDLLAAWDEVRMRRLHRLG